MVPSDKTPLAGVNELNTVELRDSILDIGEDESAEPYVGGSLP